MDGVVSTRVGYTGGTKKFPTYRSLGDHTETIQIEYNPQQTNYAKLLEKFWTSHDSTAPRSRQYMSAIFYHDDEEKQLAENTKKDYQDKIKKPIVTKILPAQTFYDAEDYHQKYMLRQCPALLNSLNMGPEELKQSTAAAVLNGILGGFCSPDVLKKNRRHLGLTEEQDKVIGKLLDRK